jgi:hypothetical protein
VESEGVVSGTAHLRAVITGLLGFAASEEEMLLASAGSVGAGSGGADGGAEEAGNEHLWAAVPTVAHNTEFKAQQAERLTAVLTGRTPRAFGDIDHASAAVYAAYATRRTEAVTSGSRQVTAALVDGVRALSDPDLLDPGRHPWLNGRTLWLQVIVRGFWHPTGHVGEYYQRHGRPERAIALHEHALATGRYLDAPDQALGMAAYSLACAQAQARLVNQACLSLSNAITLNPDVRANAARDPDLESLRASGRLAEILTS